MDKKRVDMYGALTIGDAVVVRDAKCTQIWGMISGACERGTDGQMWREQAGAGCGYRARIHVERTWIWAQKSRSGRRA